MDLIKEKQGHEVNVTTHKAKVAEAGARQQTALARAELLEAMEAAKWRPRSSRPSWTRSPWTTSTRTARETLCSLRSMTGGRGWRTS